jgi:two-component system, LuxR family, sensor kinase FixL
MFGWQDTTQGTTSDDGARMKATSLRMALIGGVYIAVHLLLDWLSFVHPFGAFGITPWTPSTGLCFVLVLRYGPRTLPVYVAALILANVVVRGLPVPFWVATAEALIRCAAYGLVLVVLLRPSIRFEPSLLSVRDLFLLLLAAVIASAVTAGGYVGLLVATDLLPVPDISAGLLRCWVGDMIGVAVITPFGLLAMSRAYLRPRWEVGLLMGSSVALTVWVAVIFAEFDQLQLFYLLFLPLTWIAVRSGIEGVSAALVLIQVGLVIALLFIAGRTVDVLDFQARMLVLAVTGLVAGVLVSERRLAEAQLRMNQNALAHLSRLGSTGELAATIAHEINQPLSAARTYTGLVAESLQAETLRDPSTVQMANKAAVQIGRAADVVRRLRALVHMGRSDLVPTSITRIVQEAVDLARTDLQQLQVILKVEVGKDLPPVMADRLQVEQVLINLIRNSAEAIAGTNCATRQIRIIAERREPRLLHLSVSDSGPGFPAAFGGSAPPPLQTSKPDGLGIGLSLCRSIAEAHGGELWLHSGRNGATVTITLPIAEGVRNA